MFLNVKMLFHICRNKTVRGTCASLPTLRNTKVKATEVCSVSLCYCVRVQHHVVFITLLETPFAVPVWLFLVIYVELPVHEG